MVAGCMVYAGQSLADNAMMGANGATCPAAEITFINLAANRFLDRFRWHLIAPVQAVVVVLLSLMD